MDRKRLLKDHDIRKSLLQTLQTKYFKDPNTRIIEEFGICQGKTIVDVAVINGALHGFEIKSECDTLERLPRQQEMYSKVLDYVTIASTSRHLIKIEKIIPKWWGILEAKHINTITTLKEIRPFDCNPEIDPSSMVQLLWHEEALDILKEKGLHKGFKYKARKVLWNRLIEHLPFDDLRSIIRDRVKTRQNWKADLQPEKCVG